MTAELVRGQNHPLPQTRVEIRIAAGEPVVAGATLSDERGMVRTPSWIAHPGAPRLPGVRVTHQAAARHRLAVDLDALPEGVECVHVLLVLTGRGQGATVFGSVTALSTAVTTPDGTEIAQYTPRGLGTESAVIALELYRRRGAWKVRAVGQGYAGGLADLLRDQGLAEAGSLASAIHDAVALHTSQPLTAPSSPPGAVRGPEVTATPPERVTQVPHRSPATAGEGPIGYRHPRRRTASSPSPTVATVPPETPPPPFPQPVAGDATGWSMDERLHNQVWGMFEDLARTVAAYRGAVGFAEARLERDLDQVLSDPASRGGPAAAAVREAAQAREAQLVDRARAALDRDLAQLAAEATVVEPAMPPPFARWDNPVWQAYQVPTEVPMAVRMGDLSLPECADLRIPMLVRLPLQRGLWIDSGRPDAGVTDLGDVRQLAAETATSVAARLLASYPLGAFAIQVIDPVGAASAAWAPLRETGAVLEPPAVDASGVSSLLTALTQRVDLVQMAINAGAGDALPPDLDTAERLLLVHDFPHGFDDRAITQLRYLADEGPSAGVHLLLVADRADSRPYGPLLDPLWRALLRISPVADDHLADPWVGHAWTYEPPRVPPGSQVLHQVLRQLQQARQRHEQG